MEAKLTLSYKRVNMVGLMTEENKSILSILNYYTLLPGNRSSRQMLNIKRYFLNNIPQMYE